MARALYKQSKIILADEPTSGLDVTNVKISGIGDYETLYSQNMYFRGLCEDFKSEI